MTKVFNAALFCTAATIEGQFVGAADGNPVTVLDANKVPPVPEGRIRRH